MRATRKMSDELAAALEHGVDVGGRRIFLHGDVDEESIGVAIRGLYLLADRGSDPIELYVTSYGGSVDDAFALHDVTRTVAVPVHTVALGKCMSAAPLLVACGAPSYRFASENCEFMVHDAAVDLNESTPAEIAAYVEAAKSKMVRMATLLGQYTNKKKQHWTRLFASKIDRFFDAETALEWGLIDSIWSEKG